MNPILADIYSTILPSAPYIIAAYALLWVALLVYVLMVFRGTKKATAQLTLLEEAWPISRRRPARRRTSSDSRPVPHLLRAVGFQVAIGRCCVPQYSPFR